jgi:hypothetical protein
MVAKRVRGSRSSHRPGGLGPSRTRRPSEELAPAVEPVTAARPVAAVRPETATPPDVVGDDVLVLETTEIRLDQATPPTPPSARARRPVRIKADSLEARVAAEDVYVREDLRRIGVICALLLAALAVAWVLFVALDLLDLY